MAKQLIARGQATIHTQKDAYTINQSIGEYLFTTGSDGVITAAVSFTSTLKVTLGDTNITDFTIGTITKPAGFSAITVNNTNKTIAYSVAANTTNLADSGLITIPVTIKGETYSVSFAWSKAKGGTTGNPGADAYTIHSSRKNYVVSTDKEGKIHTAVTTTTILSALKGTAAITPTIGTLPTVAGCTLSKSGTTVTIVFNIGTSLAENGTFDIPVTVDGKNFTVSFAYAKARTGADGATGAAGVDANMLDWVNDWNTNKTLIGSNSVITPKVYAGVKNSNGTLTGIALGRFALSTLNASGSVVTETIDGIYGFKDGNKTFFIDNAGNAQLGRANQFIKYNAATGKVEFGSEVTLNWTNAINTAKTEAVNAAATDATNKVNAVQIGGSNFLNNSGDWKTAAWNGGMTTNGGGYTVDSSVLYNGKPTLKTLVGTGLTHAWLKLENGVEYTYSALVLCNENVTGNGATPLHYHAGLNNVNEGKISILSYDTTVVADVWKRIHITFKLTGNADSFRPFFYRGSNGTTTYWIANIKLERGNKATDWTPSVSDTTVNIGDAKTTGANAQTTANAITQKATDEKWGTKLTYIDANGIYTGTLSANTVNAININAVQITAGTINAARIDVASLKASLITAANIEALTLNVIRGKIGGWTMDADSIFLGTKNNTSGGSTSASGSMTIGSTGIRGFKWRLDATGAGAVAGGNITWDAAGNVTFASSVSLNWTTPINSLTTALGGSAYPKLTQISATGIYTGTLTATQVNAVSIDAASIKTGTLSADRIAAGSIVAAKLDAASIKASIINVDYINGLSCTFARGTIGGWSIGADNITYGSVGTIGQMPIQIRSAATGSGYWYNGAYKPQGIVMTWHQSSNAGHVVFGQIAASGNTVKTGFLGIQMMAWDSTEYFCLSANYSLSGSKEVYNRIAGWAFDNAKIWKNNVSLTADGSIQNGTKWQLNNDGAGRLANGNITWDASGNVTFASSVSLNWTTPINNLTTALGGSAYPKLTQISSTGIYTGTLTAAQVNAVSIDAASLKTGTLSADRIATGSIVAAKLDAASIKSSIINTDYINGLSCTFVRGTIGGWTITADTIYSNISGQYVILRTNETGGAGAPSTYGRRGLTIYLEDVALSSSEAVKIVQMGVLANLNSPQSYSSTPNYGFRIALKNGKDVFRADNTGAIIAGWTIDADSIFRGTKNNSSGAYTAASGSITMGSNGLRGYKWRLDATGAGAVAGGNITWDASGNVTFGSSVSLNWTSAADAAKELAQAMAFGKMLYRDPVFYNGSNSMNVYNNSANGTVTITRTSDSNAPNDSKFVVVIRNTGTSSPNCGGFNFGTQTSYRKVLITRMIAKIPTGRSIAYHSNSIGTGGSQKWLTPVAGTGDWCEYICKVTCGTASFSTTNFFSITGTVGTETEAVEWRVAYATVFDVTSNEKYTTTIDANGIYTGTLSAGQIKVDTTLTVGGSTYNGAIAVKDASNVLKVLLDRSGITAVGGTIGGWTIASNQISKNSVILSSDGSITNGTKWKFNNDGSGQVANGNISWTATGSVSITGTINATAGQIGGFEIGSGRIGSTASGTGSGGGLAIYNDLFRVGSTTSYVLFGDDTFPASAGGAFTATGRITNNKTNTNYTNCGIYIDVKNASRNFGIHSNAALLAPALISNKIKTIIFNGSSYSIDFSQSHVFFVYGTSNYSVTLPTESSVASMFGYSTLPSDFGIVFTLIYNYNYGNRLTINGLRDCNGNQVNIAMEKGDSLTIVCSKYPAFHYQVINHYS
jgi:hypothetical protein